MNQNTTKADYLATDIRDLARQRDGTKAELSKESGETKQQVSKLVARQLIHMCLVTPPLLWWALYFGVHRGWIALDTSFIVFVYSVTLVFGAIVFINLKKLAVMEAEMSDAQMQYKIAKDSAEAASRFKSAFFANISHEIRTPLTAINGFAELLLNSDRNEEERLADARVIRRNGEHLLTLINDILDLSKIEAGKMEVEPVLCCPAAVVGDVCSMLRLRAAEKDLTLDVKFDGPIPQKIKTDPTRLRQVLINLIANAVKFTKEGGVSVAVSIQPSVRAPKPTLVVKITDTGIGIGEEGLAALFQPFVQGDASISRQYGGSGLGLAISRHYARALGGDVVVTSEVGRGSTFTVTVATGSLVDVAIHERPEDGMDVENEFAGQRVRISGTVLVAEDGVDNQTLIAAKLRETGLKIEIVSNGQLACEKALGAVARGTPYDLILMDVQMPVMDGFAATLHLRSNGYRGPIIALTANAMDRDRTKCLNAGCNDFVSKPIQMEKLFKAIGRYLTIVKVAKVPTAKDDAAVAAARAAQTQKFYQNLPGELAQIEAAIEREDRVRLKEIAQLILGVAAAAGLKDLAPQAAKLMQLAERETPWTELREAVAEFARDAQPQSPRQAA